MQHVYFSCSTLSVLKNSTKKYSQNIRDATTVFVPTNKYSTMFTPCVLCTNTNVKFYSCINVHFGEGNVIYLKNKMFEICLNLVNKSTFKVREYV